MMRLFSLLLIAVALSASPWLVDRSLLERELGSGAEVEALAEALRGEGIELEFKEQGNLLLWKGEKVSISLASAPLVPYHLWIEVAGRRTLEECTEGEFQELYRAIWMCRKALRSEVGAQSFLIFATNSHRNGKGSDWAGMEILPSLFGEVLDGNEKTLLNDYLFYNRFLKRNDDSRPDRIEAIRGAFSTLQVVCKEEHLQESWTQKIQHPGESIYQCIETIHKELLASGALLEGEAPPLPPRDASILENRIDLQKCAFCTPKVIQKQIVAEWKGIYILMSHKPVSPFGNFLVLPKRHQCGWDPSPEEAALFFEAVCGVKRMLEKHVGGECILYVQDGPGVGQTVPHTHMHIYQMPHPIKMAVSGILHVRNKRPVLAFEEMREVCEKYQPLLMEELQKQPRGF